MFRLTAGGRNITGKSNNIAWGTDAAALGAQLTFDSLYDIPEGEPVSTFFGGGEDIRAIITDKTANRYTYSYTALDYAHLLKNEVVKQFNAMPANAALISLLGEYGIQCACCAIPTPITQIYKESLSSILDDILEQATAEQGVEYVREMRADTLVIDRLTNKRIAPELLIGADLAVASSVSELVNRVIVVSGDEENAAVRAIAEDGASIARYGLHQVIENVDDKDAAQAGAIAANRLALGNRILHTCTVPTLALSGGEMVKANRLIHLRAGRLNGWYRIRAASHTLADGKHQIAMELEW